MEKDAAVTSHNGLQITTVNKHYDDNTNGTGLRTHNRFLLAMYVIARSISYCRGFSSLACLSYCMVSVLSPSIVQARWIMEARMASSAVTMTIFDLQA